MEKIKLANGNTIEISSASNSEIDFNMPIDEFAKVYPEFNQKNLVKFQILSEMDDVLTEMTYFDVTGHTAIEQTTLDNGDINVRERIFIQRMTKEQIAIYEQSLALAEMANMLATMSATGEAE